MATFLSGHSAHVKNVLQFHRGGSVMIRNVQLEEFCIKMLLDLREIGG